MVKYLQVTIQKFCNKRSFNILYFKIWKLPFIVLHKISYFSLINKSFPKRLKCVYAFGLSVCARCNSRKYSWNVLEFICVIHIWFRMDRIENGRRRTNVSSTKGIKVFRYIMVGEVEISKAYAYIMKLA